MYRAEAVKLAKVILCSAQVTEFAFTKNDELIMEQLDLLEEYRESVITRLAEY